MTRFSGSEIKNISPKNRYARSGLCDPGGIDKAREARQLEAVPDQLLNGDVDDVGIDILPVADPRHQLDAEQMRERDSGADMDHDLRNRCWLGRPASDTSGCVVQAHHCADHPFHWEHA